MKLKNRYHLTYCEEYGMWLTLMKACYDPRNINYKHFGGRGFFLCKEWLTFSSFKHNAYFAGDQDSMHYILSMTLETSPNKEGKPRRLNNKSFSLYRTSYAEIQNRIQRAAMEKWNKEYHRTEKEQRQIFNAHHPRLYSYVKALPYEFERDWLFSFDDPEKLKFLLKYCKTSNETVVAECREYYIAFVDHFYYDVQFNVIYDAWLEANRFGVIAPALDHIVPKSKGGLDEISNLRFVTNIENWCKGAQALEVWEDKKKQYKDKFFM